MYGYVAYPGIGYRMGGRQMVTTAMTPRDFLGVVGPREAWDPLQGVGTNRKEDKNHRRKIAEYIETNPDYVLNSLLVYIGEQDAKFVPEADTANNTSVQRGTLYVRPGAKFKVGDGGHRTSAFGDVLEAHIPLNDEVLSRLSTNGQPIVIVLDDDQVRRAQDFTDLQRNAKPLNASIGQSMDRRQSLNRILIEQIVKRSDLPIFGEGSRVEFLTDTPGKLSAKVMAYKTLRYASGTLLTGTAHRDVKGWEDAVELKIASDEPANIERIADFWWQFGSLPAVKNGLEREKGVALLRDGTWLLSASVIYAIAAAVHAVSIAGSSMTIAEAMTALHTFDFARGDNSPLLRTLVDAETKKAVAGRGAWERAAEVLQNHMKNERRAAN